MKPTIDILIYDDDYDCLQGTKESILDLYNNVNITAVQNFTQFRKVVNKEYDIAIIDWMLDIVKNERTKRPGVFVRGSDALNMIKAKHKIIVTGFHHDPGLIAYLLKTDTPYMRKPFMGFELKELFPDLFKHQSYVK